MDPFVSKYFERLNARLDHIEAHLRAMPGVEYVPFAASDENEIPDEIVSLVDAGAKIEAIRQYRERYEVDLREAKQAIDALSVERRRQIR